MSTGHFCHKVKHHCPMAKELPEVAAGSFVNIHPCLLPGQLSLLLGEISIGSLGAAVSHYEGVFEVAAQ